MIEPVATTIPGGFCANDERYREAQLRPLTGEDHIFLTEECGGLLPAQWVTEALTRCVTRLGPNELVTREAIRSLTVGDREALLLHLRRLTSGDRLRCLLACPSPECKEKLEVNPQVADLLLPPYAEVVQEHELTIRHEGGGGPSVVCFRLPTGFDQEAAAEMARNDVASGADFLLRRCVQSATLFDGSPVNEFSPAFVAQLADRMAELDPQAEIILQLTCPVCGATFSEIFDTANYLMQELADGIRRLYREVHLLAYHYHWSATEILGMSTARRLQFLRLLGKELAQGAEQ
jgi:hypothetical protein